MFFVIATWTSEQKLSSKNSFLFVEAIFFWKQYGVIPNSEQSVRRESVQYLVAATDNYQAWLPNQGSPYSAPVPPKEKPKFMSEIPTISFLLTSVLGHFWPMSHWTRY